MTELDNHDDALVEDNDVAAGDVDSGLEGASPLQEEQDEYIEALKAAGRDDLIEGYQNATLRREDYSKKTMSLSDERKAFTAERERFAERERILLQALEGNRGRPDVSPAAEPEKAEVPDRSRDPEGWFRHVMREEMRGMLDTQLEAKIEPLTRDLEPVRRNARLEGALTGFQETNPEWRGVEKVKQLGSVIRENPRLSHLVESDPQTALALAADIVAAQGNATRSRKTSRGRGSAAPIAARTTSAAPSGKASTLMAAFDDAMRSEGLDPRAYPEA